jgi:hypothetical protein
MFLLDLWRPQDAATVVLDFLAACSGEETPYEVPLDFTEEKLSEIFLKEMGVRRKCN